MDKEKRLIHLVYNFVHNEQLNSTGKKNRKGQDIFKLPSVIDYTAAK